jgi:hypothetical protein
LRKLASLFIIALAIVGCKQETDDKHPENAFFIKIAHSWGNEPLVLQTKGYINPAGDSLTVGRIAYLLSDFKLKKADGTWQSVPDAYAYIDAKANNNTFKLENAPEGTFEAISFRIGLLPEINFSNPNLWPAGHPLDPLTNLMHWNWAEGYIFIAIEGYHYPTTTPELYSMHIAFEENHVNYILEQPMYLHGPNTLKLNFDVREIFRDPVDYKFSQHGTVTHSGPDDPLAGLIRSNLHSVFTVSSFE